MNYVFYAVVAVSILLIIYFIFSSSRKNQSASANIPTIEEGQATELKCMRCFNSNMIFNGTERFHVGSNSAPFLFGNLGELFVNKQIFDQYYCPKCGKVELFFRKK
jgi:Zn finger protein HypA/HybF involved in hydrogenase expression